jgi:3-phenylpropionate/trans-cinnamate dioxygenase ferredoxin reductase subunit
MRLESVPNALDQARIAGAAICGTDTPRRNVPWFWSDQYDLKLQIAGISRGHHDTVVRGSIRERRFCVLYVEGDQVVAADAVNCPADFSGARDLISRGTPVDVGRIADTSVSLAALAA